MAAFFTKELRSDQNHVISCIVVLPPYQRKGFGRLLISLAHEIARRADVIGTPEKPLSDLGQKAFAAYWKDQLMELLATYGNSLTQIEVLSKMTSFRADEILQILKQLNILKDSSAAFLEYDNEAMREKIAEYQKQQPKPEIDPNYLIWLPDDEFSEYLMDELEQN
jgi:hypothetical protein